MKIWKYAICIIALLVVTLLMGACDDPSPTSDQKMNQAQEQLSKQAADQVGMPGLTTFTEKRLVRRLYELRDQNIATFSYLQDMNGKLWHLCDSVGYGLPYGVQFTNPHRPAWNGNYGYMLDQAEPNGLFMPNTAEGTWVMCAAPKGDPAPVYVEPRVIVSPFKLRAEGEYALK